MANEWINALKQFNIDKPKWTVPKKDTADYNIVLNIMRLNQKKFSSDRFA
jgi:hypothetical protein